MRNKREGLLILAMAITACGGPTVVPAADAAGEEFPSRVETRWTQEFEWFVEHPMLVVGEPAQFAAHLTRLADFRPVEAGRLTVELLGADGGVRQSTVADAPARSGIFLPLLEPGDAGDRRVRLRYEGPSGISDEVGWPVRVAESVEALGEAAPEAAGIGFLKEQQWRIPFATEPLRPRALSETLALPATVEPHPRHVAEVASPVAGILQPAEQGLPVPGARVGRGEVLALVSPPIGSRSGWHTIQADLTEAENRLAHAEHEEARAARLVEAGAVPARRLQEARLELGTVAARLAAIRRQAEAFERLTLADGAGSLQPGAGLPVRSPIDGIVSGVRVTAGEPVDVDHKLFRIVDIERVVVRAEVPEGALRRLLQHAAAGQSLAAEVAPPSGSERGDRDWLPAGELLDLGTEVDPESRTAPVRYVVENRDGLLRPGMAAEIHMRVGDEHTVLAVPESAVVDVEGMTIVYVHVAGETFEERIVETGMRDGGWVEIRSGMDEGERVVSLGAYQVRLAALSPDSAPAAHSH